MRPFSIFGTELHRLTPLPLIVPSSAKFLNLCLFLLDPAKGGGNSGLLEEALPAELTKTVIVKPHLPRLPSASVAV